MSWDAAAWLMLGGSTLLLFLGLPVAFLLLTMEMLFRMRRLWLAERAPRDDAVSTG